MTSQMTNGLIKLSNIRAVVKLAIRLSAADLCYYTLINVLQKKNC